MKVLLAEDDKNLGRLLMLMLRKENISVDWVEDGQEAYDKCYSGSYDVLILDWMMPKISGIDLCKRLRLEEYEGKILMLTAKDTIDDKVKGLNCGCDDYMVKPFDIKELIARLYALSRRHKQYTAEKLIYGEYILNKSNYSLNYKEETIILRPKEFKILELLLHNKGRVLPRELLQDSVWGINSDITENNLDVHIRMLRKKIFDISQENIIHTSRGIGYYVE